MVLHKFETRYSSIVEIDVQVKTELFNFKISRIMDFKTMLKLSMREHWTKWPFGKFSV